MEDTKIEWAHHTFNAWSGCQAVSAGCDNCYAEAMANRFGNMDMWGAHGTRKRTSPANWRKPIKWNAAAAECPDKIRPRIFCNSISDVFDNAAPQEWRNDLWALIEATPHLDWLLLTKRPSNIVKMLPPEWTDRGYLPNVWIGISAEDQENYNTRWGVLKHIPAAVRFVSYEPALESIDINTGDNKPRPDWIIMGGESGNGDVRPMPRQWVRNMQINCAALQVHFFFKQWGKASNNPEYPNGNIDTHGKGGALLDGKLYRAIPHTPAGRL